MTWSTPNWECLDYYINNNNNHRNNSNNNHRNNNNNNHRNNNNNNLDYGFNNNSNIANLSWTNNLDFSNEVEHNKAFVSSYFFSISFCFLVPFVHKCLLASLKFVYSGACTYRQIFSHI